MPFYACHGLLIKFRQTSKLYEFLLTITEQQQQQQQNPQTNKQKPQKPTTITKKAPKNPP